MLEFLCVRLHWYISLAVKEFIFFLTELPWNCHNWGAANHCNQLYSYFGFSAKPKKYGGFIYAAWVKKELRLMQR